jgi:DNA recombination protein RmuC
MDNLESMMGRQGTDLRQDFRQNREENQNAFRSNREEQAKSFKEFSDQQNSRYGNLLEGQEKFERNLSQNLKNLSDEQDKRFKEFTDRQDSKYKELLERQEKLEVKIAENLKEMREENTKKLDEMRKTVDENLKETVEKRFNESFKLVSDRLEQVHQGLGEMKTLASEVGNLKGVLTNVKTRGNLGEIQLGAILEQVLSPEQYAENVSAKKGSSERVEYAILLPDKNSEEGNIMLPVDSKFPLEDYSRLTEAYEHPEAYNVDSISRSFDAAVRKSAKDICDKYINPPYTTDFAIMFVPTEGLYAEIVRRTGLFEELRSKYSVIAVGPTNLSAFLNSLQMGFRTLAIQKRSVEVWKILGEAKTQFGKFGDAIDRVKKNLETAHNQIDGIGTRTRAIERSLRTVEPAPSDETALSEPENAYEE